ncbi:SRPBCC domain-containing protein [Streptacidiphilus sp. ASG 303]|uniref:SRPBCC domain-containing protein n=1 Tax=Streptacidiphilus sp. ASG 303 TaxID=2896847 RepID=UPI001E447B00|nr:SRPBCC domain-containing protein [Streptacidiphilus sp. ASG 303]MCD0484086.1 SRPBCC domain-containing protein [Streptacidiphilus sp. ASG 303]
MTSPAWPPGLDPGSAAVFAHNELTTHLPAERLWPVLLRAGDWPRWYANARRVSLPDGCAGLAEGTAFRWTTFGLRVSSTVREFVPARLLAWDGSALGSTGYHRWELHPAPGGGCRVVTQETQRGPAARLAAPLMRRGLLVQHQHWLEGLVRTAQEET